MERITTADMPTNAPISASEEPANGWTSTDTICRGCHGAGYYKEAVPFGHPNFGKLFRCECQDDKALPAQTAMLSRLRDELGHLADCTFDSFDLDRRLELFAWDYDGKEYTVEAQRGSLGRAYVKSLNYSSLLPGWLYLFGNYGAGKSHLAAAIANKVAGRGVRTTYASVPKLLDFIRAGYKDGSATERVEALSAIPFLVLDDLGAEAGKKDTDELLFVLLNHRSRERANLPTVITANVHPDDIEARISDRIYGQTEGGARILWLPIFSYRRLRP